MNPLELIEYLEIHLGGAAPRGRRELTDTEREMLSRLAEGEANEGQKTEAIRLLVQNEVAMEFLAEELKARDD